MPHSAVLFALFANIPDQALQINLCILNSDVTVIRGLGGSVGWRPTGDQQVPGLISTGNILSWKLIMKYFSTVILFLLPIQEGQSSVSGERMCTSTG